MIPVYDVKSSAIQSWGLAIPGQVPNTPQYDKLVMCPWQLSFWDNITTAFKITGKHASMPIGADTKSNGWCVKVQHSKFENSYKINEVITEEALDKRSYKVTVTSDGCGSMSLLRAAALRCGVDHWPFPPYTWDLNIAEGAINHFKQMVSAVMLAVMVPSRPIDESFVGRAAAAELTSAGFLTAREETASCHPGDTILALMHVWCVQWHSGHQASHLLTQSCEQSVACHSTAEQSCF